MNIIVGFSRPRRWFVPYAWLIMLFERTPFSHVYIRWFSRGAGVDVVYQATGIGVHFIAYEVWKHKAETVEEYSFDINEDSYRNFLHFCMTNAGIEYSLLQVMGIVLVRLGITKKNIFRNDKESQICAEMVGYVLRDVLNFSLDDDLDVAGPKMIREVVKSLPEVTRLENIAA